MKYLREALKLIATEGMDEPEWRKQKIRQKIDRDWKKHKWNLQVLRMMPLEWQWRICCARIQLGALDYEGWNLRRPREGAIPTHYPLWDGVSPGKLLVLGEQGIGDEVMYAGAFHLLPPCTIECEPRISRVFARNFPQHQFIGRADVNDASWDTGDFDFQLFMGDLARLYWTAPEKFPYEPYLQPDSEKVAYWRDKLPENPVGIIWHGRQADLDPEKLKCENAVSLQYGDVEHPDWAYVPDIDLMNDIEDIFAITSLLTKLVGIPNSNVHFAASLGISSEVILTPKEGEIFNALNWRWGTGHRTPWCRRARVYQNYALFERALHSEFGQAVRPEDRRRVRGMEGKNLLTPAQNLS